MSRRMDPRNANGFVPPHPAPTAQPHRQMRVAAPPRSPSSQTSRPRDAFMAQPQSDPSHDPRHGWPSRAPGLAQPSSRHEVDRHTWQQPIALEPLPPYSASQAMAHNLTLTLNDYNKVLESTRSKINHVLDQHPMAKHTGRIVTSIGTLAALGGGAAAAVGTLSGATLAAAGIPTAGLSIPPAALAAIVGIGAAVAGLGIAALAGALTRKMTRKALAKDPAIQKQIATLRQMRQALMEKPSLSKAEKKLLKNVQLVLGKVDGGFRHNLKTQMKVAGKTLGWTAGSLLFIGLSVVAADTSVMPWSTGPDLNDMPLPSSSSDSLPGSDHHIGLGAAGVHWLQQLA